MNLDYYNYIYQEDDNVVAALFETKTGTKYRAYFYPASAYFDNVDPGTLIYASGYFFGFTKLDEFSHRKEPIDVKIRNTIAKIVLDFFDQRGSNNVLVFVCDDDDDKHHKRNMKFDRWYSFLNQKGNLKKLDEVVVQVNEEDSSHATTYISLISHASNPYTNTVETEFQQMKETIAFTKQ